MVRKNRNEEISWREGKIKDSPIGRSMNEYEGKKNKCGFMNENENDKSPSGSLWIKKWMTSEWRSMNENKKKPVHLNYEYEKAWMKTY